MGDLQLVYYPDPRLRQAAPPVDAAAGDLRDLAAGMMKKMYEWRGIGLAGPQVGIALRIVVANLTGDPRQADQERVFINPEILDRRGSILEEEGCLSLPGITAPIPRSERVTAEYTDLEGRRQRVEAEGLASRLFQHEIDHLDGILILDKMSPADRRRWAPVVEELEEDFRQKRRPSRPQVSAGL